MKDILAIAMTSGVRDCWQERGTVNTVLKLLSTVQARATTIHDAVSRDMPVEEVVPVFRSHLITIEKMMAPCWPNVRSMRVRRPSSYGL